MIKYFFLIFLIIPNSFSIANVKRKIEIEYKRLPSQKISEKLEKDLHTQQTQILNELEKQKLLIKAIDDFFKEQDLQKIKNKENQIKKQDNE